MVIAVVVCILEWVHTRSKVYLANWLICTDSDLDIVERDDVFDNIKI